MVARELARALARLELEGPVLVAVSGGLDSSSLLHALHALARERGLELSIGHVNHGLRGAQSDADERFVRELGRRLGLPVRVARVAPGALREGRSSRDRPSLQEAARWLRYDALRQLAREAPVATAHTANDQAETLLLRLLRGTSPDGLAGMAERSPDGTLVRPLLRVSREALEAFAREQRIPWREDASNEDIRYARNRLRRHWLPGLMNDFNPQLLKALGQLAEAQRKDTEWIAARVEVEVGSRLSRDGAWLRVDAKDWAALPDALALRIARRALELAGSGRHAARVQLERMARFLCCARPGTAIELPGRLRLVCARDGFRLGPLGPGPLASGGETATPPRDAC